MLIKRILTIIFLFIFLIRCSQENEKREVNYRKIEHPTNENIAENISGKISQSESGNDLETVKNLKNPEIIFSSEKVSDNEALIGKVQDIVFAPDGKIILLDSRQNNIKIYDKKGNLISKFGRAGKGPGEFMSPQSLVINSDKLYVSDRHNKINIYKYDRGKIEYTDTINLNFVPVDMCTLGKSLIVRGILQDKEEGYREASILHTFSTESYKKISSFGNAYKSDNWLTVNQLSDGPIACNKKENEVILMYEYFPYIYSYSLDGKINWVSNIETMNTMTVTEEIKGNKSRIHFDSQKGKGEMGYSLHILPNKNIGFLLTRKGGREKNYSYIMYTFNITDGKGFVLGEEMPVLYDSMNDKFLVDTKSEYPGFKLVQTNL